MSRTPAMVFPPRKSSPHEHEIVGRRSRRIDDGFAEKGSATARANAGELWPVSRARALEHMTGGAAVGGVHGPAMLDIARSWSVSGRHAQRMHVGGDLEHRPLAQKPEGRHAAAVDAVDNHIHKVVYIGPMAQLRGIESRAAPSRASDTVTERALRIEEALSGGDIGGSGRHCDRAVFAPAPCRPRERQRRANQGASFYIHVISLAISLDGRSSARDLRETRGPVEQNESGLRPVRPIKWIS